MALHFSSACSYALSSQRKVRQRIRAVASEEFATTSSVKLEQGGEEEKVKLGNSDLKVTKLGIGAWSWGDTSYWNNFEWDDRKMKAAKAAFDVSVDCGITFFDTAEVYGSRFSFGAINSETLLGRFIKERKEKNPEVDVAVATKFAALPWRIGRQSVLAALKDSLYRLELSSVEVYQLHWPGIWGNEGYLDGLGDAVEQGLVKAVGVSNYSEKRLRDAYEQLKKRGIPLASNQVNYSLIYRLPEENGVKAACDELGISLIAYSPIAQGALTGKYTADNPPTGPRGRIYTPEFLTKLQPLINRIKEIGLKYSKTPTQVVLNWLIAQENVIPIPGAKNAEQAKEFGGALGWRLNKEEIDELRALASETKPVIGFPVEKLLFTIQELAVYNGTDDAFPILLAILGSVFDVTKGKSHYGVGGGYNHFAGRDASRAFVSGNFSGDGLTDSLRGLSSTEVKSVVDWRDFYVRTYISVGKLVGLYYDSEGNPTKYLKGVEAKAARGAQLMEKQKNEEAKLPSYNSRWSQEEGSEVQLFMTFSV